MKLLGIIGLLGIALMGLAACEEEFILPGERENVRDNLDQPAGGENRTVAVSLSRPVNHTSWTHRAGTPTHFIQQSTFSGPPSLIWSASIGKGNDRRHRITADPVAEGGRIFTIDSHATVTATGTNGGQSWSRDLTPETERDGDASGGGLAVVDGVLYVTTGFGHIYALRAATGDTIWHHNLEAAATGAPTVTGGIVYVATRNGRAWALNASDGLMRWQIENAASLTGVVGGAAPAVDGRIAVFPFDSAQITAVFRRGGFTAWSSSAAGDRVGTVYSLISDITGDPVIKGGRVYVSNPSGRTISLDAQNGDRIWTAGVGAVSPMIVDGGSIFLVSDLSEIVRLDASTGERIWGTALPDYVPTRKVKRRRDFYVHYGPVSAGGQMWVASSDGFIRSFDPASGVMTTVTELPGGAASRPIVVGGVMYVVSTKGQLLAFR